LYKKASLLSLTVGFLVVTSVCGATSLWSDTAPAASMFADRKAKAVGDTITVIIEEATAAVNKAGTSSNKSTSVNVSGGVGPIYKAIVPASAGYADKYASDGSTTRSNSLTATITVQVTQVQPTGNLVVSGTQSVKVNGENQKITVTGTVRPDDISTDNTVLSTALSNANIKVDGNGSIGSKQKPGIVSRLFGWLF
jgi:flagellar L-ring protein FlgH